MTLDLKTTQAPDQRIDQAKTSPEQQKLQELQQAVDKRFASFSPEQKNKVITLLQASQKRHPENPLASHLFALKKQLTNIENLDQRLNSLLQQNIAEENISEKDKIILKSSIKEETEIWNEVQQEQSKAQQEQSKAQQEQSKAQQEKENNLKEKNRILETNNNTQETNNNTQETNNNTQETNNNTQEQQNIAENTEKNKQQQETQLQNTLEQEKKALEAKKLFEQTLANYQALDPRYRQASAAQLETTIANLPANTQEKLSHYGISTEQYANFLLSRAAIGADHANPENQAFLDSLLQLENQIGIRTTNEHGIPIGFDWDQTFMEQNPDLLSFAQREDYFQGLDQLSNFLPPTTAQEAERLIQKFGNKKMKNLAQEVKPILQKFTATSNPLLTPEEKQLAQDYMQTVEQLKHRLQQTTPLLIRQSINATLIPTLMQYLDTSTGYEKTLQEQFAPQEGMQSIGHIEEKAELLSGSTAELKIQGTIDGSPINFYYELGGDGQLSCDDYLHHDTQQGINTLQSGHKKSLNIHMPTTQKLTDHVIAKSSPKLFEEFLQGAESFSEYQQKIRNHISTTIESQLPENETIKQRLKQQTEQNRMNTTFHKTMLPPHLSSSINSPDARNTPQVQKVLKILDLSSENSPSTELSQLRKGFQSLQPLLTQKDQIMNIKDPMSKSICLKLHHSLQSSSSLQQRSQAFLDFFDLFTKADLQKESPYHPGENERYTINTLDFNNFIESLHFPHPLTENNLLPNLFSPSFSQKYQYFKEEENKKSDQDSLVHLEEEMTASFENAFAY